MDPQQRLVLEVGYQAFVRSGFNKDTLHSSATGVFVGASNYPLYALGTSSNESPPLLCSAMSANRISYVLGLSGASMVLDTACSSSLVAVDQASLLIRDSRCDQAVSIGTSSAFQSKINICKGAQNMFSAKGRCATFDSSADGFVRGEGCGAVVLRRESTGASTTPCTRLWACTVSHSFSGATINQPSGLGVK